MENKYFLKTAKKINPCFICYKSTCKVLSNDTDFFYICHIHTLDGNFCTAVEDAGYSNQNITKSTLELTPDKFYSDLTQPVLLDSEPDVSSDKKISSEQIIDLESNLSQKEDKKCSESVSFYILSKNIFYLREKHVQNKVLLKTKYDLLQQLPSIPKNQ